MSALPPVKDDGSKTGMAALIIPGAIIAAGCVIMLMWSGVQYLQHVVNTTEEKKDEEFNTGIRKCMEKARNNQLRQAILDLHNISEHEKTPERRFKWYATLALIFHDQGNRSVPEHRDGFYQAARQYYLRALNNELETTDTRGIKAALAEVSMACGRADTALELTQELLLIHPTAEVTWKLKGIQLEAYFTLQMWEQAAGLADEMLLDSVSPEYRLRAYVTKAEILRHACADPKLAEQLADSCPTLLPADRAPVPAALHATRLAFEKVLDVMDPGDIRRAGMITKLIETCIDEHDTEAAYRYFHNLRRTISPPDSRVSIQNMLATMELDLGHRDAAMGLLEKAIKDFPSSPKSQPSYYQMFELYWQAQNWHPAVTLLAEFTNRYTDAANGDHILELLLTRTRPPWQPAPQGTPTANAWWDTAEKITQMLMAPERTRSRNFAEDVNYLKAVLKSRRGDHAGAELAVENCMLQFRPLEEVEETRYIDLLAAKKLRRAPAIIGCRADRYLRQFPNGPNSVEAMDALLDAYYDLGLYDKSIHTARVNFVRGLLQNQTADDDAEVLRNKRLTVARIAQAYVRSGEMEKANRFFRVVMDPDMLSHLNADCFLDWAACANSLGQVREAARRLQLGRDALSDPAAKRRLELARDLQLLLLPDGMSPLLTTEGRDNWRRYLAGQVGSKASRQALEDTILKGLSQSKPELFQQEVDALVGRHDKDAWMEYWLLKSFGQQIGKRENPSLRQWVNGVSGTPQGAKDPSPYNQLAENAAVLDKLKAVEKRKETLREKGLLK